MDITCIGLDPLALSDLLTRGTDHAGVRVTPVVDDAGAWPLRCCLTTSHVGDVIAIIGFSPFPWDSAYRETGPVVVHAHGCAGSDGTFPAAFEGRDQVVRASVGQRPVHCPRCTTSTGWSRQGRLESLIRHMLSDERVEFVQVNNVVSQCHSFSAVRTGTPFTVHAPERG